MEPPPPIYRPAPIPAFEPERLQDLYQLKILDTAAEERFDRYTSLTADLFEVPIVLVSLPACAGPRDVATGLPSPSCDTRDTAQ